MNQYTVSPEDCLILVAIRKSQSLREAAGLMGCDPGGLLRKVQRISNEHGLLQKSQGKWHLTDKALALVGWTQETILSQKKLLQSEAVLRIASTSWFSERVLIPESSKLGALLEETSEIQYLVPEGNLERALIEGDCDYVVVCHPPENPSVAHKQFLPEKWSVVVSPSLAKRRLRFSGTYQIEHLSSLPFIRHHDLNPDSFLPPHFEMKAKSLVSSDNLVGVRAALVAGLGWSIVPTALVKLEIESGLLIEIELDLKIDRKICLWWLRSSSQARKKSALLQKWLYQVCSKI